MKRIHAFWMALLATITLVSTSVAGDTAGAPRVATLTGAAEVPGAGDPDGAGSATVTLNAGQGRVCWAISTTGITLPAIPAHIHVGTADVAGPVVVGLTPPDSSGTSAGCRDDVDPALIVDIIANPGQYYAASGMPAGENSTQKGRRGAAPAVRSRPVNRRQRWRAAAPGPGNPAAGSS